MEILNERLERLCLTPDHFGGSNSPKSPEEITFLSRLRIHYAYTGNEKSNLVPECGSLKTSIELVWRSIMRLAIARPRAGDGLPGRD